MNHTDIDYGQVNIDKYITDVGYFGWSIYRSTDSQLCFGDGSTDTRQVSRLYVIQTADKLDTLQFGSSVTFGTMVRELMCGAIPPLLMSSWRVTLS